MGSKRIIKNYANIFRKVLQNMLNNFLVVIGPSWSLDPRKMVRNSRWHTKWMLNANSGENAAELSESWSSYIPLHQCLGKRTMKKQSRRKDNFLHFTACEEECTVASENGYVRQSAQSLRSFCGCASRITENQVTPGRLVASDQTDQENLIQLLIAEVPSNDERQGKTSCKITSKELKDYQKTRNFPNYAPKQV